MGRKVLAAIRIGNIWLKPGTNISYLAGSPNPTKESGATIMRTLTGRDRWRTKGLLKHSTYRPFGGGVSYCPGRKITKDQVFAMISIMFHRVNGTLYDEIRTEFSWLDYSTPALGVTGLAKGMDIFLNLKNRGEL